MPRGVRAAQPEATVEFKVVPCKYAFDTTDPYCATCNGMELVGDAGEMLPATECGAYSPSDGEPASVIETAPPVVEQPAPEPVQQQVEPAPAPVQPAAPAAPKTTVSSQPPVQPAKPPVQPAKNLKIEPIQAMVEPDVMPTDAGSVTSMSAESGVSVEIKDKFGNSRWYKFAYTETRTVDPNRSVDEQRQDLWDTVNTVVDDQVDATVKAVLGE